MVIGIALSTQYASMPIVLQVNVIFFPIIVYCVFGCSRISVRQIKSKSETSSDDVHVTDDIVVAENMVLVTNEDGSTQLQKMSEVNKDKNKKANTQGLDDDSDSALDISEEDEDETLRHYKPEL